MVCFVLITAGTNWKKNIWKEKLKTKVEYVVTVSVFADKICASRIQRLDASLFEYFSNEMNPCLYLMWFLWYNSGLFRCLSLLELCWWFVFLIKLLIFIGFYTVVPNIPFLRYYFGHSILFYSLSRFKIYKEQRFARISFRKINSSVGHISCWPHHWCLEIWCFKFYV